MSRAARIARSTSRPLIAGSIQSRITRSNRAARTCSSADAPSPADLTSNFRLTLRGADGKTETLEVLSAGGDWYARSEHTRGLVKLLKGPTSALAEDVADLTAAAAP